MQRNRVAYAPLCVIRIRSQQIVIARFAKRHNAVAEKESERKRERESGCESERERMEREKKIQTTHNIIQRKNSTT